jgi:hypothetical protein
VPAFGTHLAEALSTITTASPGSRIVVLGYLGSLTPELLQAWVERDPAMLAALSGDGPCDLFDPSGTFNAAGLDTLMQVVRGYEAEQERVCAQVPACSTDGGVSSRFVPTVDMLAADGHFNVVGHAATADLLWPVVLAQLDT